MCQQREMLVQVEQGIYSSRRAACDVDALLRGALGNDGSVDAAPCARVDEKVLLLNTLEALSNARKYRLPGTPIAVSAALESRGELHAIFENAVRAEPDDTALTEAFKLGASGTDAPASSTGVGLPSARKAAEAAGGRVWLEKRCTDYG